VHRLWYALEVYNGDAAVYFLQYNGYNIEDPHYTRWYIHNRTKAHMSRRLRLFPGYLFVRPSALGVEDWRCINSTTGVSGPLADEEGMPQALPRGVVEQLAYECRVGRFDEHLADGPKPKPTIKLQSFRELHDYMKRIVDRTTGPLLGESAMLPV